MKTYVIDIDSMENKLLVTLNLLFTWDGENK